MESDLIMKKLKRIVNDFFLKIHERNLMLLDVKRKILLQELNKKNAIIGVCTRVFEEAKIYNNLNDKSKIIIGNNCDIKGELLIFAHGGEIVIGNFCFIGERSKVWSAKKIVIGDRVLISHNVNIHDNNSHPLDSKLRHEDFVHISTVGLQKTNNLNEHEIVIGDDVWIGFNATIMKGVTIGKGAIIGANTIITKDIPDFAVCVGNPMKIIKYTK